SGSTLTSIAPPTKSRKARVNSSLVRRRIPGAGASASDPTPPSPGPPPPVALPPPAPGAPPPAPEAGPDGPFSPNPSSSPMVPWHAIEHATPTRSATEESDCLRIESPQEGRDQGATHKQIDRPAKTSISAALTRPHPAIHLRAQHREADGTLG